MIQPTPDPAPQTEPTAADDGWAREMAALRARYSGATDGILFCIWKLQQNPDLTIRDFRDEARLYGVALGGRALHSARVLLGLEKPAERRSPAPARSTPAAERSVRRQDGDGHGGDDVASQLLDAVRGLQDRATSETRRLRAAIESAIEVLQAALDGD